MVDMYDNCNGLFRNWWQVRGLSPALKTDCADHHYTRCGFKSVHSYQLQRSIVVKPKCSIS